MNNVEKPANAVRTEVSKHLIQHMVLQIRNGFIPDSFLKKDLELDTI